MSFASNLKKPPGFRANPYLYIAVAIAALTAFYLLFTYVDTQGLQEKQAVTRVVKRHYCELSHTSVTSTSGGSVRTHSRAVPPAWMVAVTLDGSTGWGEVSSSDYDKMKEGTEVEVVYARKRITRDLRILAVRLMRPVD